jgi:uncharacterized protein
MSNSSKPAVTTSPCVRNCCLDKEDICVGCFRHINEIVGWASLSDEDKKQIVKNTEQRRAKG